MARTQLVIYLRAASEVLFEHIDNFSLCCYLGQHLYVYRQANTVRCRYSENAKLLEDIGVLISSKWILSRIITYKFLKTFNSLCFGGNNPIRGHMYHLVDIYDFS